MWTKAPSQTEKGQITMTAGVQGVQSGSRAAGTEIGAIAAAAAAVTGVTEETGTRTGAAAAADLATEETATATAVTV